jgi:aspartate aminotransferase
VRDHRAALAGRLRDVEESATLALAAKAAALAKAGRPVLNFTAGEPDVPTPGPIQDAGIQAIRAGHTTYTPVAGIPELRAAIADSVNRLRQTAYEPADTLVTCGAKHALCNVFQALCGPGDEVLIPSPCWVSFPPLVRLAGARPVIVPTREADGFVPEPEAVRQALSERTKVLLINSPSNPTGAVIRRERLIELARIALDRHLVVVSDEIYDQLVYPPARHVSIVEAEPALRDGTIVVGGVSKTYSMTGWRIGWAVGPRPWIEAMTTVQSHSTSNPTSISQWAALAALAGDQTSVARMREEFQRRRDRLVISLNRLAPLRCLRPDGAFYVWCNVTGLGQPAQATAGQWLQEALVATVPGEAFGAEGFVRFSYAVSQATIDDGVSRLADWLAKRPRP